MRNLSQNPPLKEGSQDRYCPDLPLPAYKYIPGKGPKDEHRQDIPQIKMADLPPERWKENQAYLYGIDLYHHDYFYEAHEVWEALWHKVGHHTDQGKFLKAMIQLAAARLKISMGQEAPARRLLSSLRRLLGEILQKSPTSHWMGIDLKNLLDVCEEKSFEKVRGIRLQLRE